MGSFLLLPSRCNSPLVHTELRFLTYKCWAQTPGYQAQSNLAQNSCGFKRQLRPGDRDKCILVKVLKQPDAAEALFGKLDACLLLLLTLLLTLAEGL